MIYKKHIHDLIRRTLIDYNLYSLNAFHLVLGTICQESKRGTYLRQKTDHFDIQRHAIGIGQTEYNTFRWLQKVYVSRFPEIANIKFEELEYNMRYSILFVRLRYLVRPENIPDRIEDQAAYWKKYYNTVEGSGTVEEYLYSFKKYA